MGKAGAAVARVRGRAAGWLVLLAAVTAVCSAAELSPAEERGRQIYFTGTSPMGDALTARFGGGAREFELPGEAATCGSCHGADGKGRPESGVLPSNIAWPVLVRPYGHVHGAIEHPAFDAGMLGHYLRSGQFPGGRQGDPAMPVYELSDRDLADLLAYMRRVGSELDPGLGAESVRIGTLVPAAGPLAEVGLAIRDALAASFAEVNAGTGIFGRRLELVVHEIGGPESQRVAEVAAWLATVEPFALLSPFTPGLDRDIQTAVAEVGVPVVGPFTQYSLQSFALNRQVFYLHPGLAEQFTALVQFAAERPKLARPRAAVVYPAASGSEEIVAAIEKSGRRLDWPPLRRAILPAGSAAAAELVERLAAEQIELILFLGPERELRTLTGALAASAWRPWVLAAGALSGGLLFDVPTELEDRFFLAYPTLPQDRDPWAMRAVARMLRDNEPARGHLQAVIAARSAAAVLVEALRRSGRDLTRGQLMRQLEGLFEFDTGLTPPITYTANRRVGALGAYILGPELLDNGRLPATVAWREVR